MSARLNWTKTKTEAAISRSGAIDKHKDREFRENDRAARWLAKVEASKSQKKGKRQ